MRASLKAALFLGIAPLVTGIAIFLAWVLSRAEWLMGAGMITIYAGIGCVAVGVACLAVYLWRSWRAEAARRRRLAWQAVGMLALFLANFAVAGGAVYGAIMIETRYTVSITNHSSLPLESSNKVGPFPATRSRSPSASKATLVAG